MQYRELIDVTDKGKRVDLYLLEHLPKLVENKYLDMLSRSFLSKAVVECVQVNGDRVKKGKRLNIGDEVTFDPRVITEMIDQSILQKNYIVPEHVPLNIIEEADDWLVIHKPKGVVVHPGVGNWEGTLANSIKGYLERKGEYDKSVDRAGVVHRFDKGVSGLMIIAKTRSMQVYLVKQFEAHNVVKVYRAKVEPMKSGMELMRSKESYSEAMESFKLNSYGATEEWIKVEGYIGRDVGNRRRMKLISSPRGGYKYSLTYIKPLSDGTILIKIETGRMHQIRATLKSLNLVIVGDTMYGASSGQNHNELELEEVLLGLNLPQLGFRVWTV
ncbi:MAG: Pseudouridine synthase [candidate division WS6 bacterium GW2011_GWF2_39_15]|uniref:Pseudouridine synthase n=1 Tax=candidate division WS6 bacterium GW2011_GWF2_39_15 TaxID=1619100 RepID=A0A0G0Q799_9BACT|nr:MAG: Pseudouridine synthase [candidate division WS6 bacterium GW2011_GWF2_39_15]